MQFDRSPFSRFLCQIKKINLIAIKVAGCEVGLTNMVSLGWSEDFLSQHFITIMFFFFATSLVGPLNGFSSKSKEPYLDFQFFCQVDSWLHNVTNVLLKMFLATFFILFHDFYFYREKYQIFSHLLVLWQAQKFFHCEKEKIHI